MFASIRLFPAVILCAATIGIHAAADEIPPKLHKWFGAQEWVKDTDGPIVSLGKAGDFDDMHIFAPAVADADGQFLMWYCGSRGTRMSRVFRLGLAKSTDGKHFERHSANPVLEFRDGSHSVLTPALLRNPDGTVLRENGKLRMWFSSTAFGKTGLHTLHESTSRDGVQWTDPSPALLDNVYCPTVIKTELGYQMWFADVSRRPWLIRHASSTNGTEWKVTEQPVLQISQPWEAEILVYPTVVKIADAYLMWYGSYDNAVRRQTTAIGFAASLDGLKWYKNPHNPVIRPDPQRPWESNYVGSGCVMRLADGSFRYWYASRKQPPFENLYFAINTARWPGPNKDGGGTRSILRSPPPAPTNASSSKLSLPPKQGDTGVLISAASPDSNQGGSLHVLEIVDQENAVVRAWYFPPNDVPKNQTNGELTFVDLWLQGIDTSQLTVETPVNLSQRFRVAGNKTFDTDCGKRGLPLLEAVE